MVGFEVWVGVGVARARMARGRMHKGSLLKEVGCGFVDRVVMILPQVHLRKPCYDFTFL